LPELDSALDEFQRSLVRSALERYRGNKSKAAQALKISRPRLLRLCEQLGLAEE
jgi:DNA-binding NtrC family response regulator